MAYTLNTGHALYANLIELIGVQGGALVSHKTARTFTEHADASYVTGGTWGEAFRAVAGGFTTKGASFSPALSVSSFTTPNFTLFVAFNTANATGGGGARTLFGGGSSLATVGVPGNATAVNASPVVITGTTSMQSTGAHSIALRRADTTTELVVDGISEGTGAQAGINAGTMSYSYLCGQAGASSVACDGVWWAWFDRLLTVGEIADLHASLGASNAFGLVDSGDATAPTFSVAPAVSSITASGATVSATIDETGDIYCVVVPQGDTTPTPSEVIAGTASGGGAATASASALAGTTLSSALGSMAASTDYKAVFVARDDEGTPNVQASVTVVNFSTAAVANVTTSAMKNGAGTLRASEAYDYCWWAAATGVVDMDTTTRSGGTGTTSGAGTANVAVTAPGVLMLEFADGSIYYEAFA